MHHIPSIPANLNLLKNPPKQLFYKGNLELLQKTKIAIVGTRRPNAYTKLFTQNLASMIFKAGGVVVSGGALGVDIIAHTASFPHTIMIAPTDLNHFYPSTNKTILQKIYTSALALSEYENNPSPRPYHFLERNRIVIALSDIIIIPQADLASGSMESAKIALTLNKPIYVLPHRIGESEGTNSLLLKAKARAIYNPQAWIEEWFQSLLPLGEKDEILKFCALIPSFDEAYARFGDQLLEYEMEGKIERKNGKIYVL